MDYARLGSTGLEVSRICLGCMSYGEPARGNHEWSLDEESSRPFIQQALEAGINFFDTANVYSDGSSEEIVGRALSDFAKRDEVVLATKVRMPMRHGPNGAGLSRKAIMTEIDDSLRRLGTDYVDLYQIHRWDYDTPIEETLEALHDVVKAGKARYIGASSMYAWQFSKALYTAELHGWTRFVSMQNHVQPALSRGGARDAAALRRPGHRRDPVEPARARPPDPRPGRNAPPAARPTTSAARCYADDDAPIIDQVRAVAEARGVSAGAGRAGLGAGQAGNHRADRRRHQAAPSGGRHRGRGREAHAGGDRVAREAVRPAPGRRLLTVASCSADRVAKHQDAVDFAEGEHSSPSGSMGLCPAADARPAAPDERRRQCQAEFVDQPGGE